MWFQRSIYHYKYLGAFDSLGAASFDTRGLIGRIYYGGPLDIDTY